MTLRSIRAGFAGVVALALLAGGCGNAKERARMEEASQENVTLKTQITEMVAEQDSARKDAASAQKDRDQYKGQLAELTELNRKLMGDLSKLRSDNDSAQARIKSMGGDLAKAKSDAEAAKKAVAEAEQLAVKLRAAEDGVNAMRAKSAEVEKAAASAADAANKAKEQAAQLAQEKALLQDRLNNLNAELAKKNAPPGGGNTPKEPVIDRNK
jgi:colicin import membrane protein